MTMPKAVLQGDRRDSGIATVANTATTAIDRASKQEAAEALLFLCHSASEGGQVQPGEGINATATTQPSPSNHFPSIGRIIRPNASSPIFTSRAVEHFTDDEALKILTAIRAKRASTTSAIRLEEQQETLWENGLLSSDDWVLDSVFVAKEEDLPSFVRVRNRKQTPAQLSAEALREAKELESSRSSMKPSQMRLRPVLPTAPDMDREGIPLQVGVSRSDLLRDWIDFSTLIDVEALAEDLVRPGEDGVFHASHFHSMQEASRAMEAGHSHVELLHHIPDKGTTTPGDVDKGIEKIDAKTKFTKRLHAPPGSQMTEAHGTIVPSSLLEKTERPFSTDFFTKDKRVAVFTEDSIDEHIAWCSRRFANQNVLLEEKIMMKGGGRNGIVPRSDDAIPMLGSTGIDAAASRAVEALLSKDEVLDAEPSGQPGEDSAQDPLVWVRTDAKGSSTPCLEIVRRSEVNPKKHKLGMYKVQQKVQSPKASTKKKSEAKEGKTAKAPSLASSTSKAPSRRSARALGTGVYVPSPLSQSYGT